MVRSAGPEEVDHIGSEETWGHSRSVIADMAVKAVGHLPPLQRPLQRPTKKYEEVVAYRFVLAIHMKSLQPKPHPWTQFSVVGCTGLRRKV